MAPAGSPPTPLATPVAGSSGSVADLFGMSTPKSPGGPVAAAQGGAAGARIVRQRSSQGIAWPRSDEVSVATNSVLPTARSLSPDSLRDMKKQTVFSHQMKSGEGMRDALTHCPERLRRVATSLSPRGLASSRTDGGGILGGSVTLPVAQMSDEVAQLQFLNGTPRSGRSVMSVQSIRSPRSQSAFNPRARPRSESEYGDGTARCRSGSPRVAEDHLWRELFHEELDAQKVPRLRETGKDIGSRGKSSNGIPWRQIPSFDRMGLMAETGDPHYTDAIKRAAAMPVRKKSEYGHRHRGGGMKDLLHGGGSNENTPPMLVEEKRGQRDAREAWLDLVKRRQEAKMVTPDEDKRAVHHTYRKQRKSTGSDTSSTMKDMCPYYREDSIPEGRAVQPPTPHKRNNLAPPSALRRTEMTPVLSSRSSEPSPPSERVMEARRDWQYSQDKTIMDGTSSPAAGGGGRSPGGGAVSRASSARSLGADAINRSISAKQVALTVPIHSVRARPSAPSRQRWK